MIHFIPESNAEGLTESVANSGPYAEAVARLASIRQALACVEQFAGDEPSDSMAEAKLAAAWPVAGAARQRCYDKRSARTAAGAAAGLEAVVARQDQGIEPNPAALARLKRDLGQGIDSIDQLFSL
jgi:hypothetical protein